MVSVYDEKKFCCGCRNCLNVCPAKSIRMIEDEYGFEYPEIDRDSCINCGRCRTVCPMTDVKAETVEASYAVVLDDQAVERSASGGAFYALAKAFIENDGVVFGCAYDDSLMPRHIMVDDVSELSKLQGSKYVQSEMDCQNEITKLLKTGRTVLFSGTPCQTAAIKKFVGRNANNLFTVELVCHGVPSRALWKDYIDHLSRKRGGKISDFQFRAKNTGKDFCSRYTVVRNGGKKEYVLPSVLSYYYYSFLKGKTYRESCYSCSFAQPSRQADITICDFWGYNGEWSRELKNVSACLVQGEKGRKLFDMGRKYLLTEESSFDSIAIQNEQLRQPSSITRFDEQFFQLWKNGGAGKLEKHHMKKHWKAYLLHILGK